MNARTIELVEVERLRPHEEFKPERLATVSAKIRAEGAVDLPIIVDRETLVIIDGHHRWWTCRDLGCRYAPVVKVEYLDDAEVTFTVRPESPHQGIGKRDVLARGQEGRPFPYKTTKHFFSFDKAAFAPTPLSRLGAKVAA